LLQLHLVLLSFIPRTVVIENNLRAVQIERRHDRLLRFFVEQVDAPAVGFPGVVVGIHGFKFEMLSEVFLAHSHVELVLILHFNVLRNAFLSPLLPERKLRFLFFLGLSLLLEGTGLLGSLEVLVRLVQ